MIASHKAKQPIIDNAVIYCRVSSVKQTVEGTGLSSQETRCRQHAQFLNLDVVKVFSDDMTGSVIDRPGIKDLVKFLKANKQTKYAVIIDDISRLARGVVQHHMLRDMIKKAGGILTSPSLDFADDSDSLFRVVIPPCIRRVPEKKRSFLHATHRECFPKEAGRRKPVRGE